MLHVRDLQSNQDTVVDLGNLRYPSDPRFSPDGASVAFEAVPPGGGFRRFVFVVKTPGPA